MHNIPEDPVPYMTVGLIAITLMVLVLPFKVRRIEHNLEPFFLVMGILAVSISQLWGWEVVRDALKAPMMIGSIPVGIFQVVLVFGILVYYFNRAFQNGIISLANRLGTKIFLFLFITVMGLLSSIVSVIVMACILSESVVALPFSKADKVKVTVVACFAMGLGAVLTPLGEPLSTILVHKLSGSPYNAGFLFPVDKFGVYVIPGVIAIGIFGALYVGRKMVLHEDGGQYKCSETSGCPETFRAVIVRAIKVFMFVAALVLLGEGLKPLIVWYLGGVPSGGLYWINSISAVLDNATLTAVEIGPGMSEAQIVTAIMGLLIAGGMLIPGNIPNIVAAGRLEISMKEWAKIGVPMGAAIMVIYFIILIPTIF
jgi:predicted cation transporter